MHELLARLGEPQQAFKSILVGGTNGKGSTSSTLASVLSTAGYKTGLFTSPHLSYFSERFMIDGKRPDEARLEAMITQIKPHAEATDALFFEISTVLACQYFAEQGVEYAVMEVGIGGRFDSTNSLDPVLSIISNVALDHTEVLGGTVEKIAFEKAGIMRQGKPVLSAARAGAAKVLQEQAQEKGAKLWLLDREIYSALLTMSWQGVALQVDSPLGSVRVQSPLVGRFQADNVALAVVAAQLLGVSEAAIQKGVAKTRWPGRLERIDYQNRQFIIDGAHNPDAARVLRQTLEDLAVRDIILIFGANKDKDLEATLIPLAELATRVIFTQASLIPKATPPELLKELWPEAALASTPAEAIRIALELPSDATIVIAGSLYLAGEVRPLLLGESPEAFRK
ncbi:MAG: bifunctional folylpolyglutamate synthase/dihydrofolate synthase [Trueperaceae bacterium]|nr:bifunctional folylpolyglutamate synthase/dihydrofolate synthase [Trueperaceae bacterium]